MSGKEITTGEVKFAGGEHNTGIDSSEEGHENIESLFGGMPKEDLAKFGEGTFKLRLTTKNGGGEGNDTLTVELLDNSHFNGNKEYVMDSFVVTKETTDQTFKLGGVDIKLNFTDLKKKDSTGLKESQTTIEFTNEAEKIGNGVDLQVGANKDQMIGFSIENMRSRELGLGGIDVLTAESSQEAIERLDGCS